MAATPAEPGHPFADDRRHRDGSPDALTEQLSAFLERRGVKALNVVRGTAPSTRRFLVGEPDTGLVRYAVAIGPAAPRPNPVDVEREILLDFEGRLRPALSRTLPRVVQDVAVESERVGLVLTGVPGLSAVSGHRSDVAARLFLQAVGEWLAALWQDSAGAKIQVTLGARAAQSLRSNHSGAERLEPALASILRARSQLAELEVVTTLTHGCLCPRHAMTTGDTVTGVDDWGTAGTGDPLRDLGRAAVHIAADRLPEVLTGRTSFAGAVRHFVTSGLALSGVPRLLWREVLVLTQLELAGEAVNRGDPHGPVLLGRAMRMLQTR